MNGHTVLYCRDVVSGMSGPMSLGHHAMLKFPDQPGSGCVSTSRFVYAQVLPLPAEPEPVAPVPETTHKDTSEATPAPVFARVHFGTDSADLRAGEADSLELAIRLLKENPAVQVLLVGHCDPRAGEEYNIGLGMRRAQAVKKYLVNAGIEARRISVKSRGKEDTLSTGPETYWQDRRVEFQVR